MDRDTRLGTPRRRDARPPNPPCADPQNQRRELLPPSQPRAQDARFPPNEPPSSVRKLRSGYATIPDARPTAPVWASQYTETAPHSRYDFAPPRCQHMELIDLARASERCHRQLRTSFDDRSTRSYPSSSKCQRSMLIGMSHDEPRKASACCSRKIRNPLFFRD